MMTGSDKVEGDKPKHVQNKNHTKLRAHLVLLKQQFHGPEEEPDPAPESRAAVKLCKALLENFTENERGVQKKAEPHTPELKAAYRAKLEGLAEEVRKHFPKGRRPEVCMMLDAAGHKIALLDGKWMRTKYRRVTLPAEPSAPYHGGRRAEAEELQVRPASTYMLGEFDEWGAQDGRTPLGAGYQQAYS